MNNQVETTQILLVDWSDASYGTELASRLSMEKMQLESEKALNMAMGAIKLMATKLAKTIQDIERDYLPDEAQIEFGIKLDIESGALISPLSKATGGAQLNVSFTWKIDQPNHATILVSPNQQ